MCWPELHLYPFTGNSSSPFLSEVASLSDSQYFWLCKAEFIPCHHRRQEIEAWLVRRYHPSSLSSVAQLCMTLCESMECRLPGSSVQGLFLARILEWLAISSYKIFPIQGSTDISCVSCTGRHRLYHWATWEFPFLSTSSQWWVYCPLTYKLLNSAAPEARIPLSLSSMLQKSP